MTGSAAVLDVASKPLVAGGQRRGGQHGRGLLRDGRGWGWPVFEDGGGAGERETEGGEGGGGVDGDFVGAGIQDFASLRIESGEGTKGQGDVCGLVAVDPDGRDAGVATETRDWEGSGAVVSGDEEKGGVVGGVAAGVCDVDGEGAEGALVDVFGGAGGAAGGDELGDGEGDVGGDGGAGDGEGGFEGGVVFAWDEED